MNKQSPGNRLSPQDRSQLLRMGVPVWMPLLALTVGGAVAGTTAYFSNAEYAKDKPLAIEQIKKDGFVGVVDLVHNWNTELNSGFVIGLNLGSCALPGVHVNVDTNNDGRITNTRDYTFKGFSDSHTTTTRRTPGHSSRIVNTGTPFEITFQNAPDLASKLHGDPCSVIIAGAIAPNTN